MTFTSSAEYRRADTRERDARQTGGGPREAQMHFERESGRCMRRQTASDAVGSQKTANLVSLLSGHRSSELLSKVRCP